VTAETAELSLY